MSKINAPVLGVLLALALAACGGTNVGQPCTTNDDCDNGLTCYTGNRPGGYCAKGCQTEGTDRDCPGGSICAMNDGLLLCSAICGDQPDCRAGYQCNGVSASNLKVCRP